MSQAFWSGTGDTYSGTCGSGEWQKIYMRNEPLETDLFEHLRCSDHSVDWTWFDLDRRSAITFRCPGMCLAFKVIW